MAETAPKAFSLAADGSTAFPLDPSDRDPQLEAISSNLLQLPPEIRYKIYGLAFDENRVAVTAATGCHCASDTTGPYREDHRWLLEEAPRRVRRDAQQAFIELAMWELHCMNALDQFLEKMQDLNALSYVRHIRVGVFETSREPWELPLDKLSCLQSITFSPWQKGWTIDVPEREDSPALSDTSIMEEVHRVLGYKDVYEPVRNLINGKRDFKVYFVFPIRYLLYDDSRGGSRLKKWQLKTWRADLDANAIDRSWQEVRLSKKALWASRISPMQRTKSYQLLSGLLPSSTQQPISSSLQSKSADPASASVGPRKYSRAP